MAMRINTLLLVLFCLMTGVQSNAQSLRNMKWLCQIEDRKIDEVHPIWSASTNELFILSTENRGRKSAHQITDSKGIQKMNFELSFDGKSKAIEQVIDDNNSIRIVTSIIDAKSKRKKLFVETINKSTWKLTPSDNVVGEGFYSAYQVDEGIKTYKSANKDYLAFITEDKLTRKNPTGKMHVAAIDTSGNQIYSLSISKLIKQNNTELIAGDVDREGNGAFLISNHENYKLRNAKFSKNYTLHYTSRKNNKVFTHKIDRKDLRFKSYQLKFNRHGQVVLMISYRKDVKKEIHDGIYTATFSKDDLEMLEEEYHDFTSKDFAEMRSLLKPDQKKRMESTLAPTKNSYYLLDIVFKKEGGYYLLTEEVYWVTVRDSKNGSYSYKVYGDFFIFDYNEDRVLAQSHVIDRYSKLTTGDKNAHIHLKGNKMYLLHQARGARKGPNKNKHSYVLNSISLNGAVAQVDEQSILYKEKGLLDLENSRQLASDKSLLLFKDKKKFNLGILTF